jgi:phage-related holin
VGILILYLVLCDALSVFRHLHCLGMPIPHQLINRLESLKECKISMGEAKEKGK